MITSISININDRSSLRITHLWEYKKNNQKPHEMVRDRNEYATITITIAKYLFRRVAHHEQQGKSLFPIT